MSLWGLDVPIDEVRDSIRSGEWQTSPWLGLSKAAINIQEIVPLTERFFGRDGPPTVRLSAERLFRGARTVPSKG